MTTGNDSSLGSAKPEASRVGLVRHVRDDSDEFLLEVPGGKGGATGGTRNAMLFRCGEGREAERELWFEHTAETFGARHSHAAYSLALASFESRPGVVCCSRGVSGSKDGTADGYAK